MRYALALLLALLLALAPLSACVQPDPSADVVGEWTWVRSAGGLGGGVSVPGDGGPAPHVLTLRPNGRYTFAVEGAAPREGRYRVRQAEGTAWVEYEGTALGPADARHRESVRRADRDTLVLDEGCCDRFVRTYARSGRE